MIAIFLFSFLFVSGFNELAKATAMVLDRCRETRDVHTAKMAMMLSQTFYREAISSTSKNSETRDERIYLKYINSK